MKTTIKVLIAIFLAMFTTNAQTHVWAKAFNGSLSEQGNSIALDDFGNVYTTGIFQGSVDFNPGLGTSILTSAGQVDVFISKLDKHGDFKWVKGMEGNYEKRGRSIAVDNLGNVYTTGVFQGVIEIIEGSDTNYLTSVGSYDIFISKQDSAGNYLWANSFGGTDGDWVYSVAVDLNGNVYTTGFFQSTVDFDPGQDSSKLTSMGMGDIFISKLDSAGNFKWAKSLSGPSWNCAYSIDVDDNGNVYSTGYFTGTVDFDPGIGIYNLSASGFRDIYISKLDHSGNFSWAINIGGNDWDEGYSIAVDDFGNVYNTGYFEEIADFDPGVGTSNLVASGKDIYVSKFDSSGNYLWAKKLSGNADNTGRSIAIDGYGNVYTIGGFQGSVDFNPSTGTYNLTSEGEIDFCISILNSTGNFIGAKSIGGTGFDIGNAIAVDDLGNIHTTGYFEETVDFDPGAATNFLESIGYESVFISKLNLENIGTSENLFRGGNIIVYPNPSNGLMLIDLDRSYSEISMIVKNIYGKTVVQELFNNKDTLQFYIPGASGIYFIEIHFGGYKTTTKVVKK